MGHSDGDALIHAITDSLLGAAGMGDIGQYFPSDDSEWENAKSEIFLIEVKKILIIMGLKFPILIVLLYCKNQKLIHI